MVQRSLPDLTVVYVSPLRRALETAYQLFHDHPNRRNIRMVLDPDLREMIYSPAGIGYPIHDVLKKYEHQFSDFKDFDTSRMPENVFGAKTEDWYLHNLDLTA